MYSSTLSLTSALGVGGWSIPRSGRFTPSKLTKSFFPFVRNRLRQELPVSTEFTSVVTGHGKLRSYLHRFGIIDNPTCPCAEAEDRTTDHLIFRCKKLRKQRTEMIKKIKNAGGDWPMTSEKVVNNYLKMFVQFVNSTDFTDL